jgi:chromosome segregation ATPase
MDTRFDRTDARIEELTQDMNNSFENLAVYQIKAERKIDTRFNLVDARLVRLDTRFDQVDERFDQVDARLDKMDTRFDQVDARLDKMDARFDQVDAHFGQVDARLDTIETTMATKNDLAALEERVQGNMVAMEERVQGNMVAMEARILDAFKQFAAVINAQLSALQPGGGS